MKSPFNPNLNRDVFEKFNSLENIEKEVAYVNEETSNFKKRKKKSSYSDLVKKKYAEFTQLTPTSLTEEEKQIYDKAFKDVLAKEAMVQDKLSLAESGIKDAMEKRNINYSLVIKKNKKLKRAAKRFFGEAKSEITFEDYKKALKRKKELERYESDSLMENTED